MKRIILLSIQLLLFIPGFSTICSTNVNGNWNNSAIWSCGHIPTGGDTIIIEAGATVTVSANFTISGAKVLIRVLGTLDFANGRKMTIPSGSAIELTGNITKGTGGGNSNVITIGSEDVWTAADGNVSGPKYITESCHAISGCPLPLILLDFNIISHPKNTIEVLWTTTEEINSDFYTIQRSSDMVTWEDITIIYSNNKPYNNYKSIDRNPFQGISYYRLKETGTDGQETYFKSVAVSNTSENLQLSIIPNPATAQNFQIYSNFNVEIGVYNLMGQKIHTQKLEEGRNLIPINLNPGAYSVSVIAENSSATYKLIIE